MESNHPSGGLPRPAGFEDRMGHQTPAAPRSMLGAGCGGWLGARKTVLESALDRRVKGVQPVQRKCLR